MATRPQKMTNKGRLEARISLELKERLERAAALRGQTLSSFVVRTMDKVSAEVLAEHEHRQLSLKDQKAFFKALMNPPEPNQKMHAAALRYHEQ